jgi:hypothetical protein
MNSLKEAINLIEGGVPKAADVCGVSVRAVYKWLDRNRLPRTEYTGETNYAKKLEAASNGAVSAKILLDFTKTPTEAA